MFSYLDPTIELRGHHWRWLSSVCQRCRQLTISCLCGHATRSLPAWLACPKHEQLYLRCPTRATPCLPQMPAPRSYCHNLLGLPENHNAHCPTQQWCCPRCRSQPAVHREQRLRHALSQHTRPYLSSKHGQFGRHLHLPRDLLGS